MSSITFKEDNLKQKKRTCCRFLVAFVRTFVSIRDVVRSQINAALLWRGLRVHVAGVSDWEGSFSSLALL